MSSIVMNMSNPAVPGDPVKIYIGVTASLDISLFNDTGSDIGLDSNSSIEITMPLYFTKDEVQQIAIDNVFQDGWSVSHDSENMSLLLSRNGGSAIWSAGKTFHFTLSNVNCSTKPGADGVQVNLYGLHGSNIPLQLSSELMLEAMPQPGNRDLQNVLSLNPLYGGTVYISTPDAPLSNQLLLNIKNITSTPLFNGAQEWQGNPRITISFVYGSTSGSLAPDDKRDTSEVGSAWAISGALDVNQASGWTIHNPTGTGQENMPVWTLTPSSTNRQIIGTGDHANITIAFNNVISMTPRGQTQMYVQFSGFMADDQTAYDDTVFVVGINKQHPPNPSVLGIFCEKDSILVEESTDTLSIPLQWSMYSVGSVKLKFFLHGNQIFEKDIPYGTAQASLRYDCMLFKLSDITSTTILTVYCSAFADSNYQNFLNKAECSIPLIFPPKIDSFTIEALTEPPISPPASFAFRLEWKLLGAAGFEITVNDGSSNITTLPLSRDATSYIVQPTAPETIYTLNILNNNLEESTAPMSTTPVLPSVLPTASAVAIIGTPPGSILCFIGTTAPAGWLLCDGSEFSSTTYPTLYALLLSKNLPDLRGRFIVGAGAGSGLSNYNLKQTGGAEAITLTVQQMPAHRHTINHGNFGTYGASFSGKSADDHPFETSPTNPIDGTDFEGGGGAHENRPPYFAMNYIIKF